MPLRAFPHAAGLMAAPVDPRRLCRRRKSGIAGVFPQQPHPVARAFFRQHRHALAGRHITIPDDQVRMRVVRVLARLVDGGEP